jgi:hypothetical protein
MSHAVRNLLSTCKALFTLDRWRTENSLTPRLVKYIPIPHFIKIYLSVGF